ncbi:type II toxin-antitoxin system RelE/ParE family toxin [Providencia stuartii]|nr:MULTISPECIES: type II toxin-antitoxin system RelE/ParE family toxin [Providencia]MDN0006877.1 type II toxin-antitoxin system RelE/ParE family toxin [Providencia stuartii]
MKLGISPLAVQDLESIGDWIAKDNPIRALSFIEELYQKWDSPTLYAERPEILPGLRSCAYGRYLLFFRVLEAEVRIERILHGSRDIPAHFS